MRKNVFRKMLIAGGMMLVLGGVTSATEGFYENDVTPPWGRISIVGATEVDNMNYVDRQKVTVQIYAADDMCKAEEIKYYMTTGTIADTERITSWSDYTIGKTEEVTLPNTTSTNTISIVFKDKNGNTSLIYTGGNATQSVVYDLNASDAEMETGMASTRLFGAPFVVTNQMPKREGYYFKGWGINSTDTEASFRQGDIIPADAQIGTDTTATLYAIWTTNFGDLPALADVVEVGDYVNYPVYYDNVATYNSSYIAKYKGWRVISKDVDIDGNDSPGTVNLVSAGVPLTYYHPSTAKTSIENLAINFLNIPFASTGNYTFRKTGFNPYQSLTDVFNNKYTATYESDTSVSYTSTYSSGTSVTYTGTKTAGTLKVRSMTKEDLDKVYDKTGATITAYGTSVTNAKYDGLLAVPANSNYAYYWLASAYDSSDLWRVDYNGSVYYSGVSGSGVRPVVSLKSGVKAAGTDMIGAWNIEI